MVEWAITIWEIVIGRKWNKRSLCQNALINQLLQPYTIDANGVRFISNLKLSLRQFELCGGGSSKGLGDLLKWEILADGSQLTSFKVWGETVLAQQLEIKTCWRNQISSKLPISVPLSDFISARKSWCRPFGIGSARGRRQGRNQPYHEQGPRDQPSLARTRHS